MTYCLDAWAVVALLRDERAAERVEEIIAQRPIMSWINLGEVYYLTRRREGQREADAVVRDLRARLKLDLPTVDRVLGAAAIKSEHRVAYADAFAVATAIAYEATLATGDLEILEADVGCEVEDIR